MKLGQQAMRQIVVLLLILATVACGKDDWPIKHPPASQPHDRHTVLLKDLQWTNLPSPYYHFDYDDSGYITHASFSSGLRIYDLEYANQRIKQLRSNTLANKDRLVYLYQGDQVAMISYINPENVTYRRCYLTYNSNGQLVQVEWERKNGNTGYVLQRTVTFSYVMGNISQRHDYKPRIEGMQDELLIIDRFEDYDEGTNTDGFLLLQSEGEHMVLLPGVRLQHGNPRKVIRTGTGLNYVINYSYSYNASKLVTQKHGELEFTSGPDDGTRFNFNVGYSYY